MFVLMLAIGIEGWKEGGIGAWTLSMEKWNLVLITSVSMNYDTVEIAWSPGA